MISGGSAGQHTTINVQVFLNAARGAALDTAQLIPPSGVSISGMRVSANSYLFMNVPLDQPGPGGTRAYRITNMSANTSSMPPGSQVVAYVVITSFPTPIAVNYPSQVVAFVQ